MESGISLPKLPYFRAHDKVMSNLNGFGHESFSVYLYENFLTKMREFITAVSELPDDYRLAGVEDAAERIKHPMEELGKFLRDPDSSHLRVKDAIVFLDTVYACHKDLENAIDELQAERV